MKEYIWKSCSNFLIFRRVSKHWIVLVNLALLAWFWGNQIYLLLPKGGCLYKIYEYCIHFENEGFLVKVIEWSVFLLNLTILCPLKPSNGHETYMDIFRIENWIDSQIFIKIRGLWRYRWLDWYRGVTIKQLKVPGSEVDWNSYDFYLLPTKYILIPILNVISIPQSL